MKFIMKSSMLAIVLIVGVIFWSLFSGVWLENSSVFKENGLLENTQAFTLTITLLFFLAPMFNRFRSDRLLAVFFSFLTLGFILRELDIETFDLPNILVGAGKKSTFGSWYFVNFRLCVVQISLLLRFVYLLC